MVTQIHLILKERNKLTEDGAPRNKLRNNMATKLVKHFVDTEIVNLGTPIKQDMTFKKPPVIITNMFLTYVGGCKISKADLP